MPTIAAIAVVAILLLHATGAIPLASVGGPLTIGLTFIAAALAVGIHEAWTKRRGVVGWIVNIVVSFLGAFAAAQLGGLVMVMILPFRGSLAATGGAVFATALAGAMLFTVLGAWGAIRIVNRMWRGDGVPTRS